jgi:hypothetical protein
MIGGERRRLLESLATADDGCTADLLLVLGFTPDLEAQTAFARSAGLEETEAKSQSRGSIFTYRRSPILSAVSNFGLTQMGARLKLG